MAFVSLVTSGYVTYNVLKLYQYLRQMINILKYGHKSSVNLISASEEVSVMQPVTNK